MEVLRNMVITEEQIRCFQEILLAEECSLHTVKKYCQDIKQFKIWVGRKEITKEVLNDWKEFLISAGYKGTTINGKIVSVNAYLNCFGQKDYKIKLLKLQRKFFRESSNDLRKEDYNKLIYTAKKLKKQRLLLIMETICATGIRVSELKYITVHAIQNGRTEILLKGKLRTILMPKSLCKKLKRYAKENRIFRGELFITRSGKSISRKQIWAEMKALCCKAEVEPSKVFPHNLRHLFARCFYEICKDISKLADVLGHSSIETTRIYLISTYEGHLRILNRMNLTIE